MRRLFFSLLASSLMATLAGCGHFHSHGVCDCEDDDHCASRAPWINGGAHEPMPAASTAEPLGLPMKK